MLYHLFTYLKEQFNLPGAGVFYFISFRTAMAIILSLVISLVYGKRLIKYLHRKQIGETVRDLGLEGEKLKSGTPTMGGIIIIAAILIPTLLFARVENVYILLMVISTIWLGLIGFVDDYIKVFKKNKEGLAGRFKVLGQIGLGIIVGATLYYNQNVYIIRETTGGKPSTYSVTDQVIKDNIVRVDEKGRTRTYARVKSMVTTIPFAKNHELSYAKIAGWFGEGSVKVLTPIIYILFVIFIIVAVSNGANIMSGIVCLCIRKFYVRSIPQHHAHSKSSRVVNIYWRFRRCVHWLFMVQQFSGSGFYGRHRKSGIGWNYRFPRHHHQKRIADTDHLRCVPD
jgi:phospho-N-acetylmuramoyl-pentapeptide-transferase